MVIRAGTSVAQNSNSEIGGTGGSGASSVGAGTGPTGLTHISNVHNNEDGIHTYSKKFYKYSYGIAHQAFTPDQYIGKYTTPYAYIPVDWLPFYLTHGEYDNIPMNSKVLHVNCKVTLMGTRTAFDHGTTLSGTATTEYVPICKYAIGLNKAVFLENVSYDLKATEPMCVETIRAPKLQTQHFFVSYVPVRYRGAKTS